MKLFYSPASPYARKVRALAIEAGLDAALELVTSMPLEEADPLHRVNPLGRVPALVSQEGHLLVDSPVICEYLDSLQNSGLYPKGQQRWAALNLQALADGLMDSAVPWRQELLRPESQRSEEWLRRRETQVVHTLAYLESNPTGLQDWNIGTLALACAWDYLLFRFSDRDWAGEFVELARWRGQLQRPSLQQTQPR